MFINIDGALCLTAIGHPDDDTMIIVGFYLFLDCICYRIEHCPF
jgi:hypothetical protein